MNSTHHHRKGTTVIPTERRRIRTFVPTVNPLRGSVGPKFRTCLADLLCVNGSGAPAAEPTNQVSLGRPTAVKMFTRFSNNPAESRNSRQARTQRIAANRRCVASLKHPLVRAFTLALTALFLSAAPALAAAPETPETGKASAVTATTATLEGGVLNPNATAGVEGGLYRYLYNPSPEECNGFLVAPEPSGIVTGLPKQAVPPVKLTGLEPNATYSFCLEELKGEEFAIGPRVNFKTEPAPPEVTPGSESASATGFSVSLFAVVNASNEATECHFQYGEVSVTEHTVQCEQGNALEGGEQGVGLTVTGLTQRTLYHYRVIVKNATGKAEGEAKEFTTITPETPETLAATGIEATGTEATLNGVLNPKHAGEAGTYEFVYRKSPSECQGGAAGEEKKAPEPAGSFPATSPFPVSTPLTGLLPGKTYTYCLIAHTAQGEALGSPKTFTTPAIAPVVSNESFSDASSSSATLHAEVNPGGAPATYHFEYGPTPAYGSVTPTASVGAGADTVSVLAALEGLQPETEYDFRVVASNAKTATPVTGGEGSFSTFPVGLLGLPDERGYELVSPLDNGDATPLHGLGLRAAADGSAVTYWETAPPTGGNGVPGAIGLGIRPAASNVYLAQRSVAGGWTAADIQPAALDSASYQGFSSDLSTGILGSEQALVAGALSGQDLYTRNDNTGAYQLLAAGARYVDSTADGSHILLASASGLYDSTGGQLEHVNVLPKGGSAPEATFGSTGDLERVISTDGSRIFWTDTATGDLYVRENDTQPGASTTLIAEHAQYQTASVEGNKVYFTDEEDLIPGANAAHGAADLYEYDLEAPEGERLTDLTSRTSNAVEHADVVGVLGASEDGSYIYFAAAGALANSGANHQECLPASSTKCNVYVLHEGEGPKLVAAVVAIDGLENSVGGPVINQGDATYFGDWERNVGNRSAHVTPDGRHLVFESFEDLTGFHSEGGREIYMYDFGLGVSCVSCNPTGAPTVHGEFGEFDNHANAELPESISSSFALRDVSAEGDRVFFESNERLVSRVTNEETPGPNRFTTNTVGLTNVYEWGREGAEGGSCPAKTPGRPSGGCIFLLSQGTSTDISFFLDASESGNDVFIETRAKLVPQADGERWAVYDARVGATQPPAEPQCTGSGCQGIPAAPPIFATPSSVTFNGVGNFPPPAPVKKITKKTVKCAKGKKLSHGKCVKQKKPKKSTHRKGSK
jgi:hypothetical protein